MTSLILKDIEDVLVWEENKMGGLCKVNIGYKVSIAYQGEGENEWKWSHIWTFKAPLKTKIIL
jgi:hypothetical protein